MPLDAEPILYTIRWYDNVWGYEKHKPYKAVATVSLLNKDTAFITALHGDFDKVMLKELVSWLELNDIKHAEVYRHGKVRRYSVETYAKYLN